MSLLTTTIVLIAIWLALTIPLWVVAAHLRRVGPGGNAFTSFLCWANWLYCKLIHHVCAEGLDLVPKTNDPGGLIVVSNHRSPVDPMLLQAMCPFEIRWMMAKDSMTPNLNWMWKRQRQIPVDRDGKDLSSLRISIRHVQSGGVLGVFPEGAISKPGGTVKPFYNGIGFMIAKTKAPVLLAWIDGTALPIELGAALKTSSYSKVVFVDLIDFSKESDPVAITNQLRIRIAEVSGWPIDDDPLPPTHTIQVDPFSGLPLIL